MKNSRKSDLERKLHTEFYNGLVVLLGLTVAGTSLWLFNLIT
ncbi:MAG: hypothetical protein ACFFC6_14460 [Promethearchaeota archaeon]